MTLDDFKHVLDTHGSSRNSWPREIQDDCAKLLTEDAQARALLQSQHRLDAALDSLTVPDFRDLEARVMNQPLPPRDRALVDRLVEWLLPDSTSLSELWRPAMAACVPLVFGIVLGNYFSFGVVDETNGFENWDDELLMISFADVDQGQLEL